MGYERRAHVTIDVHVATSEGLPVAQGVVESFNAAGVLIAVTSPLPRGDILRFLLTPHWSPPLQVERFGEVLWTRYAFNPDEDDLVAECRVRWVAVGEAEGAVTPETSVA